MVFYLQRWFFNNLMQGNGTAARDFVSLPGKSEEQYAEDFTFEVFSLTRTEENGQIVQSWEVLEIPYDDTLDKAEAYDILMGVTE